MDLTMPNMDGITAMSEIYSLRLDTKILPAGGSKMRGACQPRTCWTHTQTINRSEIMNCPHCGKEINIGTMFDSLTGDKNKSASAANLVKGIHTKMNTTREEITKAKPLVTLLNEVELSKWEIEFLDHWLGTNTVIERLVDSDKNNTLTEEDVEHEQRHIREQVLSGSLDVKNLSPLGKNIIEDCFNGTTYFALMDIAVKNLDVTAQEREEAGKQATVLYEKFVSAGLLKP